MAPTSVEVAGTPRPATFFVLGTALVALGLKRRHS